MIIIGIDPGIDTGWALLGSGKQLLACGLGDPRDRFPFEDSNLPGKHYHVWIECPQIYPMGSKCDPNDLIKLAVRVGAYQEYFSSRGAQVSLIHPHEWKGNVPKTVTEHRMLREFPSLANMLKGTASSKRHNVIDAVGIANYGYARTKAAQK